MIHINNKLLLFSFFLFLTSFNAEMINVSSIENDFPSPKYGGTIVDVSNDDAQLFNPVLVNDITSNKINDIIFESLITHDKDLFFIPQLAKSWSVSPDKLDYIFNLRTDIFWHDGMRFDVHDVIFTIDRILIQEKQFLAKKDFIHTTNCLLSSIIHCKPYEMIDNFTIKIMTKTCVPSIFSYFMFKIIPEHLYLNHLGFDGIAHTIDDCHDEKGKYTFVEDQRNYNPIGTGCMMFKEWERGDHITLIRNSEKNGGTGYWNQHDAYLDKYLLLVMNENEAVENFLTEKSIDVLDISNLNKLTEYIDIFREDPDINVLSSPTYKTEHIAFQTDPLKGNLYGQPTRNFTTNPNHFAGYQWQTAEYPNIAGYLVRQALNYALDKTGLINHAYPQGSRNLNPIPIDPDDYYYWECYNMVEYYCYDITTANALLEEAGFGPDADYPLRSELNFKISYEQGNLVRKKICEFARDQWVNLGIDVEIESLEWETMISTHYDGRNFDAMCAGWIKNSFDPDITNIWSSKSILSDSGPIGINNDGSWNWSITTTAEKNGMNYVSYWNPTVDILIDKVKEEKEYSIRNYYHDEIRELIVDDSPYIWLIACRNIIAVDTDFYGFVKKPFTGYLYIEPYGFWPEPIGFRNIYYAPDELIGEIRFSSGFEYFSFLLAIISIVFIQKNRK